jgi:hypothetical protein
VASFLTAAQPTVPPQPLPRLGIPGQAEVDRLLSMYEVWVQIDEAWMDDRVIVAASSHGQEGVA